jgi:hypothetical protein
MQWLSPHATFVTDMPASAGTGVGHRRSLESPWPNRPKSPQPHAYTAFSAPEPTTKQGHVIERVLNPRLLRLMTTYDVVYSSNIHLPPALSLTRV